jgi:type I restriction enzyme S subunit
MASTASLGETLDGRTGWPLVRFGDAVANVTRSEPEPLAVGLGRFVGLEHLDPRRLRIRRWGDVVDGTTFSRHFLEGELLFGKRRAYQRKAAVASFDGVCSGDLLVFRAKGDVLLPDLLPFIVQSDAFVAHALGTSAGSLSPRTRWKDLADFRFGLPPVDVQHRLSAALSACATAIERCEAVSDGALALERAVVRDWIGRQPTDIHAELGSVLTEVKYGTSVRCGDEVPGASPVLRIPNVVSWFLDTEDMKWACFDEPERASYALEPGDLLMVRTNGNPDYVGRCALVPPGESAYAFASYLLRLRFNRELVRPEYLWMLFQQPSTRRAMKHLIRSSAGNYNMSASGLSSLRVPVPPLDEQRRLVDAVARIAAVTSGATRHQKRTDGLLLALENDLVSS